MEVTTKPARLTSRRATVPAARHDGRQTSWARRGIPRRDVLAFVDVKRAGRALRRRASAAPSGEGLPVGLVGADVGVFVSRDNGANWYALDQDLPNAIIGQIFWDADYLYATTYGRGLWRRRPCL
jgi:hypothetical protein